MSPYQARPENSDAAPAAGPEREMMVMGCSVGAGVPLGTGTTAAVGAMEEVGDGATVGSDVAAAGGVDAGVGGWADSEAVGVGAADGGDEVSQAPSKSTEASSKSQSRCFTSSLPVTTDH